VTSPFDKPTRLDRNIHPRLFAKIHRRAAHVSFQALRRPEPGKWLKVIGWIATKEAKVVIPASVKRHKGGKIKHRF